MGIGAAERRANALDQIRVQRRGIRWAEIFRDQDDLVVGQGDCPFVGADQQAHDAGADIAKIVGPRRQQGIVEGGQFVRPLLHCFAPREGGALVVVVDPEAGGFDQVGVFQELPMGQEDAGFRLAGALVDGAVKLFQLGARPVDRMVQVGALRLRIDGMPLDDGLGAFAKLVDGGDADAGCGGDAMDQPRLILYFLDSGCREQAVQARRVRSGGASSSSPNPSATAFWRVSIALAASGPSAVMVMMPPRSTPSRSIDTMLLPLAVLPS